jgi:DNA-binding transcriptional MerR regulator
MSDGGEQGRQQHATRPGLMRPGKLLRIGELAKRSGKSVRALHLYEELALLRPAHRSQGGFRLYHPSSVERVEWIAKLQDAGLSLTQLQELLQDVTSGPMAPEAMSRLRAVFEEKLRQTREARSRLEKIESELEAALHYLDGCRSCSTTHQLDECPDCHINGHDGRHPPTLVAGIHQS